MKKTVSRLLPPLGGAAGLLLPILAVMAIAIFIVDSVTDRAIPVAVFYVVVVLLGGLSFERRGVVWISSACILLTVLSYLLTRIGMPGVGFVSAVISLSAIAATSYLSLRIKSSEAATLEARSQLAHIGRVTTLGELTISIAHEVNQPLTAIMTNANAGSRWLDARPPNLKEVGEAIDRIVNDANRASQMLDRIRSLARREPFKKDRLNINEIIAEVVALTRREIQRDQISFRLQLANDLPPVLGDRIQLQQVILNLVMNAIETVLQVSEESRVLVFNSHKDDAGGVVVALQDSGTGIDPREAHRVFDAFYTTKASGMGMGLAISRSIIEEHGGRIWATPKTPRGAVFQFVLPAAGTTGE